MKAHGVMRILATDVTDFNRYPGTNAFAPTDIT